VFRPSAEEIAKAKNDNAKWESAVGDDASVNSEKLDERKKREKGLADRGKDWLLGKK
jgi:hypothetical protein